MKMRYFNRKRKCTSILLLSAVISLPSDSQEEIIDGASFAELVENYTVVEKRPTSKYTYAVQAYLQEEAFIKLMKENYPAKQNEILDPSEPNNDVFLGFSADLGVSPDYPRAREKINIACAKIAKLTFRSSISETYDAAVLIEDVAAFMDIEGEAFWRKYYEESLDDQAKKVLSAEIKNMPEQQKVRRISKSALALEAPVRTQTMLNRNCEALRQMAGVK